MLQTSILHVPILIGVDFILYRSDCFGRDFGVVTSGRKNEDKEIQDEQDEKRNLPCLIAPGLVPGVPGPESTRARLAAPALQEPTRLRRAVREADRPKHFDCADDCP